MNNTPFNNSKYLEIQKKEILKRISIHGEKLYLEFGGKLLDDWHASRVLPGFEKDSKLQLLLSLKDQSEIIMVINSEDVKNHKIRGDLGITYDVDVERLIITYRKVGLPITGVVFSFYEKNKVVDAFMRKLKNMKVQVYKHYKIEGYPVSTSFVVSKDGFGRNEYIKTEKPLVVVTAPGPGSGKMACCLSQLYHDKQNGIKSSYAKYETFPVWNLPLDHPVNVAYEAATIDLLDFNLIDPYHLSAYNKQTVNYNRDIEAFPLVRDLLTQINGECPYKSPTDMGVNMIGFAIEDDEKIKQAARNEIIRRFYQTQKDFLLGKIEKPAMDKFELLLNKLSISLSERKCVKPCLVRAEKECSPCLSIELPNGEIVVGRRSDLLTATSAALLNALKKLAGLPNELLLISPEIIVPIQNLKLDYLHNANPKIHGEEILIALSIQAKTSEKAKQALEHIPDLINCESHSSCLLALSDYKVLNKLQIHVTEEAKSYIYKLAEN